MNVWLIKDGENLPVQENVSRMRMWMLADALNAQGHDVVWWSSTHSHQRKQLLYEDDRIVDVGNSFRLSLLSAGGYAHNRSFSRLRHHHRLARRFLETAETQAPPDVIIVSFPILDLLHAAVTFGQRHNVPVIVDIRDPWPDALINIAPRWFRALAHPGAVWMRRAVARCVENCTSVVACSTGFLNWALALVGRGKRSSDKVFHLGRMHSAGDTKVIDASATRARYGIPANAALFTFVGSFGHVYDLETVCNAASLAWQAGRRDIHVILVGDGTKYDALCERTEDVGSITLTGWLGSSDVRDILNASDVGLAPCEQLPGCVPNKISEYSAAQLPILSSLRGDMVTLLQKYDAGYSYNTGDFRALYELMVELASRRSIIEEKSKGSGRMFAHEFDASEIYPAFVAHIEHTVGGNHC